MKKCDWKFWVFVSPALFIFIIVELVPVLIGFAYSCTDWNGLSNKVHFIGVQNFIKMFTDDPNFVNALLFTFGVAVLTVLLVNAVGLLLAILVTQKIKGANFLRSIFFMPNLIGGLLLGFTWKFLFMDVFSAIGKTFGLNFLIGWLSNTQTGFFGIVILNVWQMSGYMMVVYIAQLQQIPSSIKEAALIDGANWWQMFKNVIFPLLMPAFTIGMFLSISNSFKMFDQNFALTGGDPYRSTEMLALNIYDTAYSSNQFGYAQAKSIVFLLIVAAISLTQLVLTKRKEVEM